MQFRQSNGSARSLPSGAEIGIDGQTILVPIAEGIHLSCDAGGVELIQDVTDEFLEAIGPYMASMQAYVAVENKSTNFRFKLIFRASATGRTWNAAQDVFAYVSANGETTQAPYNTTLNFGRKMQWGLACSTTTGVAAEGATVWVYLAIRLRAS